MLSSLPPSALVGAFLFGLAGSLHCIAMCGGVAGMSILIAPERRAQWQWLAAWQSGRLCSYALVGATAGWVGLSLATWPALSVMQSLFAVMASITLLMTGAQLMGFRSPLQVIERGGAMAFIRFVPLLRPWMPPRNPARAFLMGSLWGLVPCGFLYTMILAAAAFHSPLRGAAVLMAFGIGTLPSLFIVASGLGMGYLRNGPMRYWVGLLVMATALVSLSTVLLGLPMGSWICQ